MGEKLKLETAKTKLYRKGGLKKKKKKRVLEVVNHTLTEPDPVLI